MKPKPALLSPLIRSDVQGLILARLFLNAGLDYTITELADFAITSVPTAMREVDRLVEAEYVVDKNLGRVRLIRANQDHPLFQSIFQIVAHSYGPAAILPAALKDLFGLQQAFIHGEWAARLAQIPGPIPTDLDLILVGNMNRIDASRALAKAEKVIGKTINVQFASNFDWERDGSDFIREIKSRPLLALVSDAEPTNR
ncbi:MAG: hypothetical protein RJA35_1173 [Actinomycetota bacterium]